MKQNREAALRRELEERGTLPAMPDADELRRRAQDGEAVLNIWKRNNLLGTCREWATYRAAQYRQDGVVDMSARQDAETMRRELERLVNGLADAVGRGLEVAGGDTAQRAANALRSVLEYPADAAERRLEAALLLVDDAAAAYRAAQNGKKPGRTRKPRRIVPDGCYNAAEVARIVNASSSKIVWDWVKRWDTKSGWIPTGFHWPIPRTQQSANELRKMRMSLEAHNKEIQKRKKLREELGESTPRKTPKPRKAGNPELLGEQDEDAEEDTED